MRILYGVTGVGIGHAIRSKTIISHLIKKHKVDICSYGLAYEILKKNFQNVHKLDGLELIYDQNKVHVFKTLFTNLIKTPEKILKNFILLRKFSPDIVITDFEPITYFFAKMKKIKVIGIDNINAITRIKTPALKHHKARFFAKMVSQFITPNCDEYLITTFFKKVTKARTIIFPPVLRNEIINAKPRNGSKIIVYLTSKNYENSLINAFAGKKTNFIVYGFNKIAKYKNVLFKKFSEAVFLKDLTNAKAVVCYGGFSLISEALYLKKPVLVLPIKDHYEQLLNADYVERHGYGRSFMALNSKTFSLFMSSLKKFRKNLEKYPREGNKKLFSYLDNKLS